MAPLYSRRFLAGTGGATGRFDVPAGNVAVVRCFTVCLSVNSGPGSCSLADATAGVYIIRTDLPAFTLQAGQHGEVYDLRVVFPGGSSMVVYSDANVNYSVSGYLFLS